MSDSLEQHAEKMSLRAELQESIKTYPTTWKTYAKQLAPAVLVSATGSALGQWAATKLGLDSKLATTTASYVGGFVPGYITFFGLEYFKNKEKYPSGIFSKEFGAFAGTFLAADYVADLSTFTPSFIALNVLLTDKTDFGPASRGAIAWGVASLAYVSAMAGLHPLARRATKEINTRVKSVYHKLKKKK